MTHLNNVPRRGAIKAFRTLGFEMDDRRGKGSHALIYHPKDTARRTMLARRDPIARGTLNGMLRDLQVTLEEFKDALGR